MPPKKTAAVAVVAPVPPSNDAPPQEDEKAVEKKAAVPKVRKTATHPSTAVMVNEALKELDSKKGSTSQAIQNYIKQKYTSVDLLRLKNLVRKALIKGIESGALVRPTSSTVATGAQGKFRLAPKKPKVPKPKAENTDPNEQKPAKDGAKRPKKTGANKDKEGTSKRNDTVKDSKPPKKVKSDKGASAPKVAPAKRPKAKKAAEYSDDDVDDDQGTPESPKAKEGKASQGKAGSEAAKATGKRGKKTAP